MEIITLTTLTLFGSVVWFWIIISIFLLICFLSDIYENGFYAFGTLVIISILCTLWGEIDPFLSLFTIKNVLIYLGIGLVFSVIRTYFSGRKLGEVMKVLPEEREKGEWKPETKSEAKAKNIEKLKGSVFRWWFMWIVSLIVWLVKDLIKDLWNYIYSKLKLFYNFILNLGINSIK